MKNLYEFLFLALASVMILSSCENLTDNDKDDPIDPPIEENIAEEKSADYKGGEVTLEFSNGTSFKINPEDNSERENENISVSLLEGERYFNRSKNLVFDFSKIKNEFVFEFSCKLKENLVKEDILLLMYAPEASDEQIDGTLIDFDYDPSSGVITAKFKAPSSSPEVKSDNQIQSGNKYSRLNLSWADRQELADAPKQKIIQMPYYEQPEGTCWATSAAMLARAYTAASNRKDQVRVIDFVKYMQHSSLNEGMGLYAFKRWLPAAMNIFGDVECETSTFVSKSNMLDEIIKKLDENKPLIFNLNYPGVGAHAVLIVGYEIDLISASKVSVRLLVHNPQNISGEAMYEWKDYDWLMKEKSLTEAFQILYPKASVPGSRALHTLGMPINGTLGELAFVVESSSGKTYSIRLQYDENAKYGYKWVFPNTDECEVLPDTTKYLRFKLPIYNAGQKQKNLSLTLRIYNQDSGENLFDETTDYTSDPGTGEFEVEMEISSLISATTKFNARMELEIWDGANYQDGYDLHFTMLPKMQREITLYFGADAEYITRCKDGNSTHVDLMAFGAQKMMLDMKGKVLEGSSLEKKDYSHMTQTSTRNLRIEFDKEVNPTKIVKLDYEITSITEYEGEDLGQGHSILKLNNISLSGSDVGNGWMIIQSGSELCDYLISSSYTYTPYNPDDCSVEMTDFKCAQNSGFNLTIK
ncbi:MAG: C39 family peptidase [Bacteroidota bacterium]